jgi:trypsin-like peptidase
MRRQFSILVLVLASSPADAGCIEGETPAHSTVSITRHFDAKEREAHPDVLGIRGTGWFISSNSLVTIAHVAVAMRLSDQTWKHVEFQKDESTHSIPVRLQRLVGSHSEKIAVLELQSPYSGAQSLPLRVEPLVPDEPLVSLAYPGGARRVADGRFVQHGDGDRLTGTALLEMYDGNDRLVLDHGASGAPVLDCKGRVVAVVSRLFTTTIHFMSRAIRISTGWGNPNVVALPISVLQDSARVQ